MTTKLAATFVIALLIGAAMPATAAPTSERDALVAYLSGYEDAADGKLLGSISPNAATLLVSLATDPTVKQIVRTRAVACLGLVTSPEGKALLVELVDGTVKAPFSAQRQALFSLALGYAEEAKPIIAKTLADPDPLWREAGIRALSIVTEPWAAAMVKAHIAVETEAWVEEIAQQVLVELQKPAPTN